MKSDRVVVISPHLDQNLSLLDRIESLSIDELISQLPSKRFEIAIFPRTARLDEQGLNRQSSQQLSHMYSSELRAIIRAQVNRNASLTENTSEHIQHILVIELSIDTHPPDTYAYSSMILRIRNALPLCVRSSMK